MKSKRWHFRKTRNHFIKMQDFVRFFCKIPLHNAKKCCIIRSGTDGSKEFEQSGLPPLAAPHIRPEMTHDGMRLMVCDGLCEYLE